MKKIYRTLEFLTPKPSKNKDRALLDAQRIAKFLADTYGCEVWGIGSLFEKDGLFRDDSDIDLVASRIPDSKYFHALALASEMTTLKLDLIPLEDANQLIAEIIYDEGRAKKLV